MKFQHFNAPTPREIYNQWTRFHTRLPRIFVAGNVGPSSFSTLLGVASRKENKGRIYPHERCSSVIAVDRTARHLLYQGDPVVEHLKLVAVCSGLDKGKFYSPDRALGTYRDFVQLREAVVVAFLHFIWPTDNNTSVYKEPGIIKTLADGRK